MTHKLNVGKAATTPSTGLWIRWVCVCVCVRLNFAFANLTSRQYRRFPCACFLYCCCCCFHSRYHPEGEDFCGILTKSVDAVTLVPTNILKQHHFHSILLNFLLPQRKNRTQIDEINPKELSYSDSISSQSWEIEMNGTVPFFSLSLSHDSTYPECNEISIHSIKI